ncbi:4Fe-4S binding protein [Pelagicoccus sp. SDUM812003]|uniref:4Fe-4S binding protein n=1 Tax=Pelagicoccus sp. SDUM812003 TaxID=3041267 RepID=UPI00280E7F42|nr:4Fe-4S binding protein [Pelagicoccus sp. SDUM812003]MDQ8202415.1 4Fe-4S binding protein [Pelagicoccus sp. SDUM812003]
MTGASKIYSRRDFFSSILRFSQPELEEEKDCEQSEQDSNVDRVAIVQGRFCLAYQHSFCSVCVERCPEPGAMISERGIPRVVADACTGCGVCSQVCPAPRNAILLTRKPAVA